MPKNWKTYKLGDILKVKHGYAFKGKHFTTEVNNNMLLTPGNFKPQGGIKILLGKQKFYNGDIPKDYLLKKDDLLIAMTDLTQSCEILGSPIKIKDDNYNYLHNQRLGLIENELPIVSKEFLYYYFNHYEFRSRVKATKTGSTVSHTAPDRIYECDINLPPLKTQKQIASILSALDDKIELNLQMNKTLEDMAMALYKHWFVDFGPFQNGEFVDSELGKIPKGWQVSELQNVATFSNGYAFKSKDLLKEEEDDCYHIFKMGHIKAGGGLKPNGTKSWIKKDLCVKLDKYILQIGDILMSMTDMKDNMTILGHTALMNENKKYVVNQRVGLIRANGKDGIDYPFLYLLTNSYDFIGRLRNNANSGVQVNLSTTSIKIADFVLPTKDVNIDFNNQCKPLFEQINHNNIENQSLTKTRDTLLPKLISGEVQVKDEEQQLN